MGAPLQRVQVIKGWEDGGTSHEKVFDVACSDGLAVDPATLADNPRFNPLGEEDRDDFGQDFAQLQYTRELGADTSLTASLYVNSADGWFQLWDDPVAQTNLLRYGIDQSFRAMVSELYPDAMLQRLSGEHPIYSSFYQLPGLPKIHEHDGEHRLGDGGCPCGFSRHGFRRGCFVMERASVRIKQC